jgi:hypothetical protein
MTTKDMVQLQLVLHNLEDMMPSTWPKEADAWLQHQNVSGWPTEEMNRYSAEQGCFVVPVACKKGVSTSTLNRECLHFLLRDV